MTYFRPAAFHRIETVVSHSRFIASAQRADSAEAAKAFISQMRAEMPTANHHVYAFRAGHGNSVIEGMSDDGEPSGTSGPPVLAVLRGTDLGDTVVVVTRYFGGTKLGTGGLVRAYSDAARAVLTTIPTEQRIPKMLVGFDIPYPAYELVKRLIQAHQGQISDETFAGDVSMMVIFPSEQFNAFQPAFTDLTNGRVELIILEHRP